MGGTMRREQRRFIALALGVIAVGLTSASLAWACTPLADVAADRTTGPAGTAVTLTGKDFAAGNRVEIRWNSARGALLAEVAPDGQGGFQATVRVPRAPEDTYTIVALSKEGGARLPFTVGQPNTAVGGGGQRGQAGPEQRSGSTSGDEAVGGDRTSATARGGDSSPARGGASPRPVAPAPRSQPEGGIVRNGSGGPGAEPTSAVSPASRSGQAQAAGSVRRADDGGQATAGQDGRRGAPDIPGERSAIGDLWSGVSSERPSRTSVIDPGAGADDGLSPQRSLGVGLLGLGLMGIAGFGLVAAMRRRAVKVRS